MSLLNEEWERFHKMCISPDTPPEVLKLLQKVF